MNDVTPELKPEVTKRVPMEAIFKRIGALMFDNASLEEENKQLRLIIAEQGKEIDGYKEMYGVGNKKK